MIPENVPNNALDQLIRIKRDHPSDPNRLAPGSEFSRKLRAAERSVNEFTERLKRTPPEERSAVTKELESALQHLFDVRTQMRESQIADLEKRIQTLRTQLQERVEKMPEIVQLRLQTLVNDANGLTF